MQHLPALKKNALPSVMLDRKATVALGAQIAQALREAIRSGQLPIGARLPPSRDAAQQWGVGRNAVIEAYDDLRAAGLVETRGRHGSFIALHSHQNRLSTGTPVHEAELPPKPFQNWKLGQPSTQLLPLHIWRTACREAGRHLPPNGYGDPRGVRGLREAIAEWLRCERGVTYDPRQIVLTQGAGAAVEALARLLVQPGDLCVVENPGYTKAALAMERAGAKVMKVRVDASGIDVNLAFQHPPKLIHLPPTTSTRWADASHPSAERIWRS